jgi:flagellar biosynthesis protein
LAADRKPVSDNLKPPPPTSEAVAVALAAQKPGERSPKVVAGGRGKVAEQILQIAFQNGVKVREDADLAQLLSAIDIESEIPLEAFAAVAEILIYVYQANNADGAPGPDETVSEVAGRMAENWRQTRESGG